MTERERLIELILNAPRTDTVYGNIKLDKPVQTAQTIADYLLANGVIVPPCKVGDTVYFPMETDLEREPYVDVGTVFSIGIDGRHTMWIPVFYKSGLRYYHASDEIGKTVFLSRELAEKALEAKQNDKE